MNVAGLFVERACDDGHGALHGLALAFDVGIFLECRVQIVAVAGVVYHPEKLEFFQQRFGGAADLREK
jgi:hypothetical protein